MYGHDSSSCAAGGSHIHSHCTAMTLLLVSDSHPLDGSDSSSGAACSSQIHPRFMAMTLLLVLPVAVRFTLVASRCQESDSQGPEASFQAAAQEHGHGVCSPDQDSLAKW